MEDPLRHLEFQCAARDNGIAVSSAVDSDSGARRIGVSFSALQVLRWQSFPDMDPCSWSLASFMDGAEAGSRRRDTELLRDKRGTRK